MIEYSLIMVLGIALLVLIVLFCAALIKFIAGGSDKDKRELVYMLKVDQDGRMRIKRYKGNMNVIRQWGDD